MRILATALLIACNRGGEARNGAPVEPIVPARAEEPAECTPMTFAESTPVAEASAAAFLTPLGLVVTSDSGHDGDYAIVDPESGVTIEMGRWPLGDAGDDVEGLAVRDGRLYGLSSAGWIRAWERRGDKFELVDGPYPLAPEDGKLVCDKTDSNCGKNYEGLCLATKQSGTCIGFAASKEDGALYCLVMRDGAIAVRADIKLPIARKDVIADCAFDDQDRLWVGANLFGLNMVYRVDDWRDLPKAKVVAVGALGVGFAEVIAVRGDTVYRMSDMGGSPSKMAKFRCSTNGR